jgi:membrane-bound metal-dependent hydrolase YbcI (DUF457 family)
LNTLHHLLYASAFANTVTRSRRERRWLMLAAIAPDIDGALFWNRSLWEHTHHTVGHNVFFAGALVAAGAAIAYKGRRLRLAAFTAFSVFALHYALDLAISATWPMRPFWPVWPKIDVSPGAFVTDAAALDWWLQGPVQWALVAIAIALAVHTWRRYGRSALELLSWRLDDLLVGYLARTLAGARCVTCRARAGFRCLECTHAICGKHLRLAGIDAFCESCRDG